LRPSASNQASHLLKIFLDSQHDEVRLEILPVFLDCCVISCKYYGKQEATVSGYISHSPHTSTATEKLTVSRGTIQHEVAILLLLFFFQFVEEL